MKVFSSQLKGCTNSLREICRVPSYAAAFPFEVKEKALELSKRRLLYCLVVLSVITAQATMLLKMPDHFYLVSPIAYLVYCVEQISVKVALFVGLYCFVKNRRMLKRMFSLICEVEQSLAESGVSWTMRIDYSHDAGVVAFLLLVCLNHISVRDINFWTFSKMVTYYFTMALLYAVTIQFKRLVLFVCTGFTLIHYGLRTVMKSKFSYLKISQTERMITNYHKLYSASLLLNTIYSPQILLIIFSSFLTSTGNIYFFYQSFATRGGLLEMSLKLAWVMFYFAISLHIVWPCTIIDKQAKEFNTLLYQLMIDDTTNEISNNKKLRLHISMKREVVFTACGFFTLDYTLIHSMIAAATTYLVILIQFGHPTASAAVQDTTTLFINTTDLPLSSVT